MDPRFSAQDVLRCDLCETPVPPMYCDFCHVKLCKACVGEHLFDLSKEHKIVPFKQSESAYNYPKCATHINKPCELHCKKCNIPVCSFCVSDKHNGHTFRNILQDFNAKKEEMKKDLQELKKYLLPKYEEIGSEIDVEKSNLDREYGKLITAVVKKGEDWHREINNIVKKLKSEIDEMKSRQLALLLKQENTIKHKCLEVRQSILDLKKMLDLNDVSLTSGYKSHNEEFRKLPFTVKVSLPCFSPQVIKTEQLRQMFGSLSVLPISSKEHDDTLKMIKSSQSSVCPEVKPELTIQTKALIPTDFLNLYSVSCLSDEEIWTCGDDKIMKLYNLQGKLLKSIQTKSGNIPGDIAVTRSGDLVYTDPKTKTVNIVKNGEIREVIRLRGWDSCNICSTYSGDLLVTMNSDDKEHSKVVRYFGSIEKQSIQFADIGQPLYSCGPNKYVSENGNLDICVADYGASAVVVVNQAGKLRFRYTSYPKCSGTSFYPLGITTDSQNQILISDCLNHQIHLIDQDGQFLRFIFNEDLYNPYGLCVDTKENILVADWKGKSVLKMKYK
ncbi:tripartite motif-containing protein 2-like [Saccostrea cucullata]|uniref:tripartite motif-containing protein 2-like n=1 Tax=Saccostrea cuccullata TaxID=36930 RepID=UPI002ED14411